MKKMKIVSALLLSLLLILAACNNGEGEQSSGEKSGSGTIKLAWNSQPPTLDTHVTTSNVIRDIARPIFETLVTFNSDYEVVPMLADSVTESNDRKTIDFKLRKGVKFHNGKEMKAEDVVASMTKWQSKGAPLAELGDSKWEEIDEYTVRLNVENPSLAVMYLLADVTQTASIMPKEVIDKADATGVSEYIGTGPFKLKEWKFDSYIHLEKFDDYSAVSAPASGLSGKKEALVDDIMIHFVPDSSTRVNGIMSGEYDYAFELPFDSIDQLESKNDVVIDSWPFGFQTLVFNKQGLFEDVNLRKAANYALDNKALLELAFSNEQFYRLEPAFMRPEQVNWYTDAGKENYNVYNIEKAKEYLEKAGYNGEEVKILTSSDYDYHYNSAIITQEALQDIGMNVVLDVTDWATLLDRRTKPELWDIFYTSFTTVATPLAYPFLLSDTKYPGWTNNPKIDQYLSDIKQAKDQTEATQKFAELQELLWDDLPVINVGMTNRVSSYSTDLVGYTEFLGPIFWNTKKD